MTTKAQAYISRKIEILRNEGYPEKQAIAIAYSMARERGYKARGKDDPPTTPQTPKKGLKEHKMKSPKPKSGYGYHTERKTWKKIKDDEWDIVMIGQTEIKKAEYVGHRRVDGVSVIVWKIPYGFIAQKIH